MNIHLLTQPNTPKPVHGLESYNIYGQEWYNQQKQNAINLNNNHCHACGVHHSKALYHQELEPHQIYDINYKNGSVTLKNILTLCHSCHSFIHGGILLEKYNQKQISYEKLVNIITHGLNLLIAHDLDPFYHTVYTIGMINMDSQYLKWADHLKQKQVPQQMEKDWSKWHVIIGEQKFYSKLRNIEDWKNYNNSLENK